MRERVGTRREIYAEPETFGREVTKHTQSEKLHLFVWF